MKRNHHATRAGGSFAGLALALALTLMALTGCGSGAGTGPTSAEEGRYDLVEVNGSATPVVVHSEETGDGLIEFRVVSGSIELDGKRYSAVLRHEFVVDGAVLLTDELKEGGNYSLSGTTITFTPDSGVSGTSTGTLVDRTLTIESVHQEYGAILAVYSR